MSNIKNFDKYLNPVLDASTDSDLEPLVGYLKKKFSEYLTIHPEYKKHNPNHTKYTDIIADEIRNMGGNSFGNLYRGGVGPSYYEIVCDVAKKVKARHEHLAEISVIEKSILDTIFKNAWDEMSEEDKANVLREIESNGINVGGVTTSSLVGVFEAGGFYSYQLAVIVANHVAHIVLGHGLSFAANAALTKSLSIMAGPLGWAVCGAWTALDISGPAYSVTVPCVVHIALLRMKSNSVSCLSCSTALPPNSLEKICSSCAEASEKYVGHEEFKERLNEHRNCIYYQYYERTNNLKGYETFIKAIEEYNKKVEENLEMRRVKRENKAKNRKKKRQKEVMAKSAKVAVNKAFGKKLNDFVNKT